MIFKLFLLFAVCSVAKAVTDYLTPLILDVVLDTEHLGCELCDVLAIPNSLDPNLKKPTNEVVSLHCIKANGGTADLFQLDLSDSNTNLLAKLNPTANLILVLHGYIDSFPGNRKINGVGWMQSVITKLANTNQNACAVNWGQISNEALNYFTVAINSTVKVTDFLVKTLLRFEANGVSLAKTSLVGHSLGAQIAGKVGGRLNLAGKKIGYIYGLDPAGPCFCFPCLVNSLEIIDPSDATYVQIINSYIVQDVLNKPQWGCKEFIVNNGIVHPGAIDPISAHVLAYEIFDYAIDHNCYTTDKQQLVGIHAEKTCDSVSVLHKVSSNAWAPYCTSNLLGEILGLLGK